MRNEAIKQAVKNSSHLAPLEAIWEEKIKALSAEKREQAKRIMRETFQQVGSKMNSRFGRPIDHLKDLTREDLVIRLRTLQRVNAGIVEELHSAMAEIEALREIIKNSTINPSTI